MARRSALLSTLADLVKNPHSTLYSGFITCKLDSTHALLDPDSLDMAGKSVSAILYSPEENILKLMEKYRDVQLPPNYLDMSHFEIHIQFEGQTRTMQVPNPLILRRRCCAVFTFEIKSALGLLGTAQELWVEPLGLVPMGLPPSLSDPILFQPSSRANGASIIHASKLKANQVYELLCEDYRTHVLDSLTPDEQEQIRVTFNKYDIGMLPSECCGV